MTATRIMTSLSIALVCSGAWAQDTLSPPPAVWVRVQLLRPADVPYQARLTVHPNYSSNITLYAGQTVSGSESARYVYSPPADVLATQAEQAGTVKPGEKTPWIELTRFLPADGLASVRFLFEPKEAFAADGVEARFDVATDAEEGAIVRAITERDPGNVISLRIPLDLAKDGKWLLSIREDAERRLREIRAMDLPEGPMPRKIWCMTGFRPWDMYTDPSITEREFEVARELGMNGFWDFTPETWELGKKHGVDRTTVFWRSAGAPTGHGADNRLRLDWAALDKAMDEAYQRDITRTRSIFGDTIPPAIVDLMDEPAGVAFVGPEYDAEFARYLQGQGFAPEFFGKTGWDEVQAIRTDSAYFWWDFFKTRAELDMTDLRMRRLFYWSGRFLTYVNARLYAMGTRAVEKYAPELLGTRVNLGPPWWYDYGTIPRGIDAFEMVRQRGVTVSFNEDWIGNGDPRWPLETTTFLADWGRAPFRPDTPLGGGFITRDANRTAVKLRVFGFLARDCKIFDFYYYGPSYGHFDHWSDNPSMVRGVAELTRHIGRADAILWEAHPPRANVALLYPDSWPVWKEDDTEQVEMMMTYLALLHAHIPVDIVSAAEVADGRFAKAGYACLYVVNESVRADAAAAIESWVKAGGALWASGWAAARDRYNTPSDAWNGMLGVSERSWKPAGDLSRHGEMIGYADHKRPYFSRHSRLTPAGGEAIPGAEYLGEAAVVPEGDAPSRAYRRRYGRGTVQVVPWTAGKDYLDGHRIVDGTIAEGAILYPDDSRRDIIAGLALERTKPPAMTSVSQVLAWPLWTRKQGAVLIANYTGNSVDEVRVTFRAPMRVRNLQSVQNGNLRFRRRWGGLVECTLPVRDVIDVLIVNQETGQ